MSDRIPQTYRGGSLELQILKNISTSIREKEKSEKGRGMPTVRPSISPAACHTSPSKVLLAPDSRNKVIVNSPDGRDTSDPQTPPPQPPKTIRKPAKAGPGQTKVSESEKRERVGGGQLHRGHPCPLDPLGKVTEKRGERGK